MKQLKTFYDYMIYNNDVKMNYNKQVNVQQHWLINAVKTEEQIKARSTNSVRIIWLARFLISLVKI